MTTVTIDDKDYDLDSLSADARGQLDMLITTDNKIRDLQRDLAIAQTARVAYARALSDDLAKFSGDTIKIA